MRIPERKSLRAYLYVQKAWTIIKKRRDHMKRDDNMPKEQESLNWREEIISWIKIIITAAAIAFLLNNFIIANSRVPSGSMEKTIMTGDRVIGSRLSYYFGDPERGDVAIFHFPDDPTGKTYYVKRVIGLPGDTIDIRGGKVYLNNSETPLEESYLPEPMEPEPDAHYEVPEDCYFMLGDNRNFSADARRWNQKYVEKKKIIAKVLFRYFPSIKKIQ
jgi:signal peptidase I